MGNTILTPTAVTREALRILHQKCNFIGSINRQYDDSFAKSGAKIGDSLKIRLPNQYTVTTGAVLNVQNTAETSVTLQVATQKHVGMNFSSAELALSMDDFSKRIIAPAMSVLAASIEADAMSMYLNVWNQVNNQGSAATFAKAMSVKKALTDTLTPADDRVMNLHTQATVDMLDATKGLFQDSTQIKEQYRQGKLGMIGGFDFYENTHWPTFTTGSSTNEMDVNGANQTGASVTVTNGGSKTLAVGDIITFEGCNRVHPETKADTGVAQQFVVTAAVTSSGTSIAISPSIVTSGATQNVSASPTTGGAVTKVGSASQTYQVSMGYHKDAFTFATADLPLIQGQHFMAREVMDGISMRVWRAGDILNDQIPCRIDVLYGYKAVRPELACRWVNN